MPEWICWSCLDEGDSRDQRSVLRTRELLEEIAKRNAAFEARLKTVEAESEKFAAAVAYWRRVAEGIEFLPEVKKNQKGMLECGVAGCGCNGSKAEYFAVIKTGKYEVVGMCLAQFHAMKMAGADERILASKFFGECRREANRRNECDKRFEALKSYWRALAGTDTVEKVPEVKKNEKGSYFCGVPSCGCRAEKPVEHFAVVNETIVGLCRFSFAALKQSGAEIFAAGGPEVLERCAGHIEWLERERKRAERQANGNANSHRHFGEPGTGLRKKTKPNRAAREVAQRGNQRARLEEQERRRKEAEKNGMRYIFSASEGHGKGKKGDKKGK